MESSLLGDPCRKPDQHAGHRDLAPYAPSLLRVLLEPGECLACDVNAGRVVPPGGTILDEGGWILDHSVSPCVLRGWLILKPERHVEHLAELNEEEAASFGPLVQKTSRAMMNALDAERVYAISMGELVHHVHVYLVPRYADMPTDGTRVLNEMFSDARPWACSDEEAAAAAELVRRML